MNYESFELNEDGDLVFKHKTKKNIFAERAYRWCDTIVVVDENQDRKILSVEPFSKFDFSEYDVVTKEEFKK